jgi:hypothetical protein
MTTLRLSHKKNEICGLQKNVKVMSKKKKNQHQMKCLLVKCIETFHIYIEDLNDMIAIIFFLESPFHIINFNLLHEFSYQSHV